MDDFHLLLKFPVDSKIKKKIQGPAFGMYQAQFIQMLLISPWEIENQLFITCGTYDTFLVHIYGSYNTCLVNTYFLYLLMIE